MKRKHTLFDLHALHQKLRASSSVHFLFGAFALIWLLMAGMGVMGLYALQANNQRMEKIVHEHNVKIDLHQILSGDGLAGEYGFRLIMPAFQRQCDDLLHQTG